MDTRDHAGWGHGLRPGTTADINCGACAHEDGHDLPETDDYPLFWDTLTEQRDPDA